jgi:hypothetical protein
MFPPNLQFYALPIDDQRLHGEVHPNGGALLLDIGAVFEALDNTGLGKMKEKLGTISIKSYQVLPTPMSPINTT